VSAETAYHFTDDAKLAILQARHEALFAGSPAVGPQHLALGVIHTQSREMLQVLFPDPGNREILCRALGGSGTPAPVIPEDIGYQVSARDALEGASKIAAESAGGPDTHPLHILLGILRPWNPAADQAGSPDETALALAATGLSDSRLRELLTRFGSRAG
jgi:hypothetical protein